MLPMSKGSNSKLQICYNLKCYKGFKICLSYDHSLTEMENTIYTFPGSVSGFISVASVHFMHGVPFLVNDADPL